MLKPLKPAEFKNMFHNFGTRAFRLELLDKYTVPDEAKELEKFYNGEPLPTSQNLEWCNLVRTAKASGKTMSRVHVVTTPLSPYMRFEIEWGYTFSSEAGENIYILDRADVPAEMLDRIGDFWIFDEQVLVREKYDSDGKQTEVMLDDDQKSLEEHIFIQEKLLSMATPFNEYLIKLRTK